MRALAANVAVIFEIAGLFFAIAATSGPAGATLRVAARIKPLGCSRAEGLRCGLSHSV